MENHVLSAYLKVFDQAGVLVGETASLPGNEIVTLVSCDSREVIPGTLFVCKGSHFHEEYLRQAAQQGAFCYVSEDPIADVSIPCIRVSDIRLAMARAASLYYGNAWQKLQLVGITGTKGKSSTTYYVKSILDYYTKNRGKETGVISTIDTYDGVERFESHLTTPEPLQLQRHFANAAAQELPYMVMEVSSQALKYGRVEGVQFDVACFLNIGYDHVSPIEHPDWEDYFSSKLRIFEQCKTAVVNLDTEHANRVLSAAQNAERILTFSRRDPNADVYGFEEESNGEEITFRVRAKGQEDTFRLGMPGLFNVENALAAIAISMALKVPRQAMYQGLWEARVPGRMETYRSADRHITVIVDYAHNALSFEMLFSSVREEYPGNRIVIAFGCPGKKSLDRRRDLGRIAGTYAQHVYLTEEDPGEEDAEAICREIAVHVSEQGCSSSILVDRGDAIRAAVADAAQNTAQDTVLLVTGKGRETREKRGIDYIPVTSDVEFVRQALQEYDKTHKRDYLSENITFLEEAAHFSNFYAGYAPTAEALEQILSGMKARTSGRLFCLIGVKNGEDVSDYSQLGEVAGKYAALTVLTGTPGCGDDFDRTAQELSKGIALAGGACQIIPDREKAICFLVDAGGREDTVLLLRREPDRKETGFLSDEQIVRRYLETK